MKKPNLPSHRKGNGHRWSEPELRDLMRMWAEEAPVADIAEMLNVGPQAVAKMVVRLRQHGIRLKQRRRGNRLGSHAKAWTQSDVEFVLRRRAEGATNEQIAVDLGRTWNAVSSLLGKLRNEGVDVPRNNCAPRRLWNTAILAAKLGELYPAGTGMPMAALAAYRKAKDGAS